MTFAFDNTYARLPERFFSRVAPTAVRAPQVVKVNRPLAALLGLDADLLASSEGAQILAGNVVPAGATPIALAYAGHQFGQFAGQLGDGRAILLGEVVGTDGVRRDIQLKGSGRTPYSRGGDGRAALGPVLREYIVSEAMAALGVPTTRSLAAVTTGESVRREEVLPGAVLVRVAASHLRVGTFELLAMRKDRDGLRTLTTYALGRHYPDGVGAANEALVLLERVIAAQASLVARWLGLGFIHGVMNTDNTAISGETIDYGPCAFLDEYDPGKTFSSIDRGGRYAFANQPRIALWNLSRLAETLLPALAADQDQAVALATERLEGFAALFAAAHDRVQRAKLGLSQAPSPTTPPCSPTCTRAWPPARSTTPCSSAGCASPPPTPRTTPRPPPASRRPPPSTSGRRAGASGCSASPAQPAERRTAMRGVNPAFIPRNHRIEEVIAAAAERGDLAPFETLTRVLEHPYDDQPAHAALRAPPSRDERVQATFCGT
jgi:uncharacterized protein YdiU (UPF0061 family)